MKFFRSNLHYTSTVTIMLTLVSCQTTRPYQQQQQMEAESALESVAGAVSGRPVTKEEMERLKEQIQKDPQAQSAVQSITGTMSGGMQVKYCPVDGARFASTIETCPTHKVPLKNVE